MKTEQWQGIIRHTLTTAGGAAAAVAIISPDLGAQLSTGVQALGAIAGGLLTLAGVGWSIWAKLG